MCSMRSRLLTLHLLCLSCKAFRTGISSEVSPPTKNPLVAVLEHTVREGREPRFTIDANLQTYAIKAAKASSSGVELLVTPEYGITGYPGYDRDYWWDFGVDIPEVTEDLSITPCGDNKYSLVLQKLSCMARRNALALVVNLIDMKDCSEVYAAGCSTSSDGWLLHNTDVVFDSDGAILAKYHKTNRWGEAPLDDAPECKAVTFRPKRIQQTFGLFTCADLIHNWPVRHLVQKGVKNFVMPLAWTNEMNHFQPLAWLQSWSRTFDVNLLAANARSHMSETGSGIFSQGHTIKMSYSLSGPLDDDLLVARLPSIDEQAPPEECPKAAPELATVSLPMGAWSFAWLDMNPGRRQVQVCSQWSEGDLAPMCCSLDYEATSAGHGYVLAALSGLDATIGVVPWAAQVCAVLPCQAKRIDEVSNEQLSRFEFVSRWGEEDGARRWDEAEPADMAEACLEFPAEEMHEHGAASFGSFASLELSGNFSKSATVFPLVIGGPAVLVPDELIRETITEAGHKLKIEGTEVQTLGQLQLYGRLHLEDPEPSKCVCGYDDGKPPAGANQTEGGHN